MKLSKDPFFIGASLCLCYPFGLFLLLKSDCRKPLKILSVIAGFFLLAFILFIPLFNPHKEPNPKDYALMISDTSLNVGESGYLAVTSGDDHYSDVQITAENDCLSLNGTVFTAEKIGDCLLTITYDGTQETAKIRIIADEGKGEHVFCSAGGTKYHKKQSHGGKNAVEITKEEAEQSGKEPCKICY